jgi:hypothetical protein
MDCQFFQWLIAGAGPTTIQHALVGIGCLLAFDAVSRWRNGRKPSVVVYPSDAESPDLESGDYRQAA